MSEYTGWSFGILPRKCTGVLCVVIHQLLHFNIASHPHIQRSASTSKSYSSMQTCVERWGGPANHKKAHDKGGKFFAARKKQQTVRYSFPQMPTHFMVHGEASTPWKRLLSRKAIVLEPRSTTDLNDAIAEFKKFISLPKSPGCILMGVCR